MIGAAAGLLAAIVAVALIRGLAWRGSAGDDAERQEAPAGTSAAPGARATTTARSAWDDAEPRGHRFDSGLGGRFPGPAPAEPLTVRWRVPAGGTLLEGMVWDGERLLTALQEGAVVAWDAQGRELWRRDAGLGRLAGSPLAWQGRCYVVGENGAAAAFRSRDGKPLWRTDSPIDAFVQHGPTLIDGTLAAISQADGQLVAWDARDGAVRWVSEPSTRCDGPVSGEGFALLFGHCDAAVQHHDVRTGALLARYPAGKDAQVAGAVAVRGRTAVFGTRNGDALKLDLESGRLVWRGAVGREELFCAPALDDQTVYLTTARAEVVALERSTGKVRWRRPTGLRHATSPVLVGSSVVIGASGSVITLSADQGTELSRVPIGDATTEPAVGPGLLFFGTDEGLLVALGAAD